MAILHFEGFRNLDRSRYVVSTETSGSANWTSASLSIVTGRTPSTSAVQYSASGSNRAGYYRVPLITTPAVVSQGVAFRYSTIPVSNSDICIFNTGQICLTIREANTFRLGYLTSADTFTLLATYTPNVPTLQAGIWNYLELKVDHINQVITFRINEEIVGTHNIVLPAAQADINEVAGLRGYGNFNTQGTLHAFGDWYVNDGDFIGDVRVETIVPSGDTATKQWTPNTGSVNFDRVSEASIDNATTFLSSNTPGASDLYSHSKVLTGLIGGIYGVKTVVSQRAFNGLGHVNNSRRVIPLIKSGAVIAEGPPGEAPTTQYLGTSYIFEQNPDGNVPWTKSTVEALQLGIKLGTS